MRTRLSKIRLEGGQGPTDLEFHALGSAVEYDFVFEGGEMLFIKGAGALVMESVADQLGRYGDITYMTSDADDPIQIYGPFPYPGWRQSDGTFHLTTLSGSVSLSIVTPAR